MRATNRCGGRNWRRHETKGRCALGRRRPAAKQPERAPRSRPSRRADLALAVGHASPASTGRRSPISSASCRRSDWSPSAAVPAPRSGAPVTDRGRRHRRVRSSSPSTWRSTRSPWRPSASGVTSSTVCASTGPVIGSRRSETVDDAVKLAEPLLGALPDDHHFAGVGVAVVGVTRRADGYVHLAPNLGWRDVPLGAMLTERFGVDAEVAVANEADLGALSEHRRGVKPGVSNLLFVSGEVGIGVGIIIGGEPRTRRRRLRRRSRAHPGQSRRDPLPVRVGRMLGDRGGRGGAAAPCRRRRCRRSSVDRSRHRPRRGAAMRKVLAALDSVGGWLGLGIADLVNLFNPELVVLGGMFSRLEPLIRRRPKRRCAAVCSPHPARWSRSSRPPSASMLH